MSFGLKGLNQACIPLAPSCICCQSLYLVAVFISRAETATQMLSCALHLRLGPNAPLRRDQSASPRLPSALTLRDRWCEPRDHTLCSRFASRPFSLLCLVWGTVNCSHCPSFAASLVGQVEG